MALIYMGSLWLTVSGFVMKASIRETLKNLPDSPGVYIMKDMDGTVLYVGKAKILKNRVKSYFQAKGDRDVKTAMLVSNPARSKPLMVPAPR